MSIEQRLAESIRSFHIDALSGSVPLNVDLDVALSVLANAVCASLRRRLTVYHHATPDTLQRRFLSTGGVVINQQVRLSVPQRTAVGARPHHHRPAQPPHLLPSAPPSRHPQTTVPWWGGRTLRFEYA